MIAIGAEALDRLMPMHLVADRQGVIRHAGPTLAKVHPGKRLAGRNVLNVFELRRPRPVSRLEDFCATEGGGKLYLRLRDRHRTQLVGSVLCLPDAAGVLLNLSFGISVIDAVGRYGLAGSDFAPTDLALEMLYMFEAKSAAMEVSRQLNARLRGDKAAAEAEAETDLLTGLKNRRGLETALDRLIAREDPFAVMLIDLDYFKVVNDRFGHAAGDHVLCEVARILSEETRAHDTVARVGGDEFVLAIESVTTEDHLALVAERIIRRLEEPVFFRGAAARVSASVGIVRSVSYARPAIARLIEDADRALYLSKDQGRARYSFFKPAFDEARDAGAGQ